MPQKKETPAGKAGARSDLLGGCSQESIKSNVAQMQFADHRQAALALLNGDYRLTWKVGQFLGQLAVDSAPLSERQANWLARLLAKHGLPPLAWQEGR